MPATPPSGLAVLAKAALLALVASQAGCFVYLSPKSGAIDLLVVDAATGAPVPYALVEHDGRDWYATDAEGRYTRSSRHALWVAGFPTGCPWATGYRITRRGYQEASFAWERDDDYEVRVALAPLGSGLASTTHVAPTTSAGTAVANAASFVLATATAPVMAPAACVWVPLLLIFD